MLVLNRRIREEIVIGDGPDRATVTILEIKGDKVQIGVTAPRSVSVHRKECADRIIAERKDASDPKEAA